MQSVTDAVPNLTHSNPSQLPLETQLQKLTFLRKTLNLALKNIDTDQTHQENHPRLAGAHAAYIVAFSSLIAAVVPQLVSLRLQEQEETRLVNTTGGMSRSPIVPVILILWDVLVDVCAGMQHWPVSWPSSTNNTQLHLSLHSLTEWLLVVSTHSSSMEGSPFLNKMLRCCGWRKALVLSSVQTVLHVHLYSIINLNQPFGNATSFSSSLAKLPENYVSIIASVICKQLGQFSSSEFPQLVRTAPGGRTSTWFQSLASGILTVYNTAETALDDRVLSGLATHSVVEVLRLALCHKQEARLAPGYSSDTDPEEYADSMLMLVLQALMARMQASGSNSVAHMPRQVQPCILTTHSRVLALLTRRPTEDSWQSQARWRLALQITSDWAPSVPLGPDQLQSVYFSSTCCLLHSLGFLMMQQQLRKKLPVGVPDQHCISRAQARRTSQLMPVYSLWIPVSALIMALSSQPTPRHPPQTSECRFADLPYPAMMYVTGRNANGMFLLFKNALNAPFKCF